MYYTLYSIFILCARLQKHYFKFAVNLFHVGPSESLFQFLPAKAALTTELVFISQIKSLNYVCVCSGSTVNPKPSNIQEGHSTAVWGFCHLHSKNSSQNPGSMEKLNQFKSRTATASQSQSLYNYLFQFK